MRLPHEVLVFVRRGDEILVLHRSERQGGYWHPVAGGMEEGETPAEAAARELREETGLATDPLDLDVAYAYPLDLQPEWAQRFPVGTEEVSVRCFLAEAPPAWEPALDWEHDEYRWCTPDEALELLHWPEPRAVLRELAAGMGDDPRG